MVQPPDQCRAPNWQGACASFEGERAVTMRKKTASTGQAPGDATDLPEQRADIQGSLAKLTEDDAPLRVGAGARLRNYFLTGLVIVGPVTITLYIAWYVINLFDLWIKPYIPAIYNPDTYLPFSGLYKIIEVAPHLGR